MKAFAYLFATVVGFMFSISSGAAELTCKQRMAQDSVAVIKVASDHATEIKFPAGEHITAIKTGTTDWVRQDGHLLAYKGGETPFPISVRTTNGEYSFCAVDATPGVAADSVVSLSRRD